MARSTKSYEERLLQLEKREQESLEKAKQYAAQKRELKKRQKDAPFLILRPAVVEVFLSVDGFLHNIASRQSRNLLLQLRRLFLHFRQIHSVPLCDTIILCRIIPYYTLKLRV